MERREALTPGTCHAMQFQVGDRFTDEKGEREVTNRPPSGWHASPSLARGLCRPPRHHTWCATSARVRCAWLLSAAAGLIGAIATEARVRETGDFAEAQVERSHTEQRKASGRILTTKDTRSRRRSKKG